MTLAAFLLICAMFAWPAFRGFVLGCVGIVIWFVLICAGLYVLAIAIG